MQRDAAEAATTSGSTLWAELDRTLHVSDNGEAPSGSRVGALSTACAVGGLSPSRTTHKSSLTAALARLNKMGSDHAWQTHAAKPRVGEKSLKPDAIDQANPMLQRDEPPQPILQDAILRLYQREDVAAHRLGPLDAEEQQKLCEAQMAQMAPLDRRKEGRRLSRNDAAVTRSSAASALHEGAPDLPPLPLDRMRRRSR